MFVAKTAAIYSLAPYCNVQVDSAVHAVCQYNEQAYEVLR